MTPCFIAAPARGPRYHSPGAQHTGAGDARNGLCVGARGWAAPEVSSEPPVFHPAAWPCCHLPQRAPARAAPGRTRPSSPSTLPQTF